MTSNAGVRKSGAGRHLLKSTIKCDCDGLVERTKEDLKKEKKSSQGRFPDEEKKVGFNKYVQVLICRQSSRGPSARDLPHLHKDDFFFGGAAPNIRALACIMNSGRNDVGGASLLNIAQYIDI